jgi:hypothetical protein
MAAVALKRELDAYNDALSYYNRGLQNYNKKADTFNASFLTDSAGSKYVYEKPWTKKEIGFYPVVEYWPDNMGGVVPITNYYPYEYDVAAGNQYYVADSKGKLTKTSAPKGNYGFTDLEGNFQTLRINPDQTGAYPTKPPDWTKTFDKKAPSVTTAQMRKLDEPSLIDVERVGDKGLINSAFNY